MRNLHDPLIKFSTTTDWDWDVQPVQLLHNSNSLTKAGAANEELRVQKTAGQTDALVIALGAYEGTGANRNGDLFKEAECIKHYKTFVKSGSRRADGSYDGRAVNRHHKNKPTDPKYGNIKAATYNRAMKRVELVVGLDNDKCAEEIQNLADGKQINVSMAAKVAHDVCTWCGHAAKTDADRCEHIPMKLAEVNKRGEMCSMDNVNPHWFEISIVGRPADRIGMSLKLAGYNQIKTAADFREMYPGFVIPKDPVIISKLASEKRTLVRKLAEMEKRIDGVLKGSPSDSKTKHIVEQGAKLNDGDKISAESMEELRKFEPSKLLKVLADHGITFSPGDFLRYLFGAGDHSAMEKKMRTRLPSVFSSFDDDGDEELHDEKYEPSFGDHIPKGILSVVRSLFDGHSMFDAPAHNRVIKITLIRGGKGKELKQKANEEELSKEADACELARQYGMYKLAALRYMNEQGKLDDVTALNVLLQNR